jgi:phosphohistidine phosphatase
MKYLTVIRHAKSSWEEPGLEDIDRPINFRGKKAIATMGAFLKVKKIVPGLIITSPAVRARKTAEGIGKILNYPTEKIKIERNVYFGAVADLTSIIFSLPDKFQDVFLIGHEPLLSALIFRLTGNELPKFPTCSVYRIQWAVKKWGDASHQKGKCEFYVYPKMLKEE